MRRRSRLRDAAEYALALAALGPLQWMPLGPASALARFYACLLDMALPRLRRAALRNLEIAMPQTAAGERERIVNGAFVAIARVLVVFTRFPRITRANISEWIRYEGFHYFQAAQARGKGVLFATAHLGNWELSAFAHALLTAPMNVVVRPLDNPWLDALVEKRRALSGNRIIQKRGFARSILLALRRNEAVGVLVDQNTGREEGVFVDFFGMPASTSATFAKLAARSGAAVIPGFAVWSDAERKYVLRFYPCVEITGDAVEDTARIQKAVEQAIREYPDQWLWMHRRWKTRPECEPPLYGS